MAALLRTTVALTLLVLGGAPSASAAAATPAAETVAAPTAVTEELDEVRCPVPVPNGQGARLTCGVLTVPERGAGDPENTVALPIIVIDSVSESPSDDPLVVPVLGDADAFAQALRTFTGAGWTGDRDVILVGHRGTELSRPTLDCPEIGRGLVVEDGRLLTGAEATPQRIAEITACRERLTEEGIDIAAYSTRAMVDDLAELRATLGYDRWNLYASDRATRLALSTMRFAPDGLRSVVLDGTVPPGVDALAEESTAFRAAASSVIEACGAEPECRERAPGLESALTSVLSSAASDPATVTAVSPGDGGRLDVVLDEAEVARTLAWATADAATVRAVPFVIDQLASGNAEAIVPLLQRRLDALTATGAGLGLTRVCAEQVPFTAAEGLALTAECEAWGVPARDGSEAERVTSGIPTLLLTGTYDSVATPAWSDAAAEGLERGTVVRVPHAGQGILTGSGTRADSLARSCAARVAADFLRDPAEVPDAECTVSLRPPAFLTTAQIDPTTALFRADRDLVQQRAPLPLAILGAALLASVGTLVYAGLYVLRGSARRSGDAPPGTILAASAAAGGNLLYAGILVLIAANADPLALAFGLPPAVWPVLLIPFVAAGAGILLAVLVVRAWILEEGTRAHRIAVTASAVASLGFTLWLLARGLLML
ncbi:alpha/beta hydrolase [Microbacterium aurantiacum]|uniref:alpha/beta hydrolase n=1 Tax=Microbacterium aurantiacum TaxID=162393 RepID=UPI001F477E71|nr:alpha/beta hydrolase [Microbacterium aurantiacum]